MTNDEIVRAFRDVDSSSAIWRALSQIMEETYDAEIVSALLPNLTSEARHFNSGRAAAIRDFIDEINSMRNSDSKL